MECQEVMVSFGLDIGMGGSGYLDVGAFYVMVVQSILLFWSETWVVTPHINQFWGGVHQLVARRILGKISWQRSVGT